MYKIRDELFKLQDIKYKELQERIIPNINPNKIIGVRTPELRKFAKKLVKDDNYKAFLKDLPHEYFDENQLHAFIISEIKDYDVCISYINEYLPYVDNWASCDQLSPKIFKKHTDKLLDNIIMWINSNKTYVIRFGIGTLMQYYLDSEFKPDYLDLVSNIQSTEYYVNMMRAWFFATALAKQYDKTVYYIENNLLDIWTHNKTIQKSIESYRITPEHKEYLKSLKRK